MEILCKHTHLANLQFRNYILPTVALLCLYGGPYHQSSIEQIEILQHGAIHLFLAVSGEGIIMTVEHHFSVSRMQLAFTTITEKM